MSYKNLAKIQEKWLCDPCIAAGYNNAASPEKKILFSPYRPHSSKSIDFRHKQEWKESILDAREAFIENHLK